MTDRVYRFQEIETGWYLREDREGATPNRGEAGLFTRKEWNEWGQHCGDMRLIEPAIDEQLNALGAARLPGFE